MKWMLVAVAGLALAGCATYTSIKERAPVYEGMSPKSPDAIADCVLPRWTEFDSLTHVVPEGDDRVIVAPNYADQISMTLTLSPAASGTKVAMRTQPSLSKFEKQQSQVKDCM